MGKFFLIGSILISLSAISCPLSTYKLCRLFYEFDSNQDKTLRYEEMTRMYHSKQLNFERSIIGKIRLPQANFKAKKSFAKPIFYFTCKHKQRIDTMDGDYSVKLAQFIMDKKQRQNDFKLNIFEFEKVYNLIKL